MVEGYYSEWRDMEERRDAALLQFDADPPRAAPPQIARTVTTTTTTMTPWSSFRRHANEAGAGGAGAAAAGVLPVGVDEETGEVWVLLGREARRQGFRSPLTWCDFGGSVCNARGDVGVAVQELVEETLGSLSDRRLPELEAWVRRHTVITVMSDIGHKVPYALFVVRFPILREVPLIFEHRYRLAKRSRFLLPSPPSGETLNGPVVVVPPPGFKEFDMLMERETQRLRETQPNGFQRNGRVRKHWMEKDMVQWFRLRDVHSTHVADAEGTCSVKLRPEFAQTLEKYNICEFLSSHFKKRFAPTSRKREMNLIDNSS